MVRALEFMRLWLHHYVILPLQSSRAHCRSDELTVVWPSLPRSLLRNSSAQCIMIEVWSTDILLETVGSIFANRRVNWFVREVVLRRWSLHACRWRLMQFFQSHSTCCFPQQEWRRNCPLLNAVSMSVSEVRNHRCDNWSTKPLLVLTWR